MKERIHRRLSVQRVKKSKRGKIPLVMAGLDPAIQGSLKYFGFSWMAVSSTAMTRESDSGRSHAAFWE
jgi:hypothetical protein